MEGLSALESPLVSDFIDRPAVQPPQIAHQQSARPDDIRISLAELIQQRGAYRLAGLTQPANGSIRDNGDGTLTYVPYPGFDGTDEFVCTLIDEHGNRSEAPISVQVDETASSGPAPDEVPRPVFSVRTDPGGDTGPQVQTSSEFADWLAANGVGVAAGLRDSDTLSLIGRDQSGAVSVFDRRFSACSAIHASGPDTLYIADGVQIWRLENTLADGGRDLAYDRLFVPRSSHTTGAVGVQDLCVDATGDVIFVSSLFSCLATIGAGASFYPVWQPTFVSRLAPEARCMLTGVAASHGVPRYVTSVSTSDEKLGWRRQAVGGGVVIDIASDSVVAAGLTMPRAPRVHDGALYVLNSGAGELIRIDAGRHRYDVVARMPGVVRSVAFHGDHALVAVARSAPEAIEGLPVFDRLHREGRAPAGGLYLVTLSTGAVTPALELAGAASEFSAITILPDSTRPAVLGFDSAEIKRILHVGDRRCLNGGMRDSA